MAQQILKLRRSSIPGKVPSTSSIDYGEIALNTYDGLAYIKRSGSFGEEVIAIGVGTSGSFTGSFFGTASWAYDAITASYAATASYVLNAISASYALSASQAQNATTASYVLNAVSASFASTASSADNFTVRGTLTAQTIVVQTITSSQEVVTGSLTVNGPLIATGGITGSLHGTSSWALSASNAINAATASNIIGGTATYIPFFKTDTTLGNSVMYQVSNSFSTTSIAINETNITSANPEALYVFQTHPTSINVLTGKGNLNYYLQNNIQNTNQGISASSDVVATANNGNEDTNYIDMGINSENYSQGFIGNANDAYLYAIANNLHIGNANDNGTHVGFFVGGSDVEAFNKLQLNPNNQHQMSGSLDISGSLVVNNGITGSLYGTASWALNAITASYASNVPETASYALQALSASFASTGIGIFSGSFSGSFFGDGNGLTNIPASSVVGLNLSRISSGSVTASVDPAYGFKVNSNTEITGSTTITGSLIVTGSVNASLGFTGSLNGTASWANNAISSSYAVSASQAQNAVSSSYPFTIIGTTIYSTVEGSKESISNYDSIFIGTSAGYNASNAYVSNFIGQGAGSGATNAYESNFIGQNAGQFASNAYRSTFIGPNAGNGATNAFFSNFIGSGAGNSATRAENSVFIGRNTGTYSVSASYSVLLGFNAGRANISANSIGINNIIIGTNVTLAQNQINAINIGGLIFGTGSYFDSDFSGVAFSGSANGRIGINQPLPIFSLDVSGSGRYTSGLTVTGSLIAPNITGSLQGTASWANNALNSITSSYILNAVSASYAATASQAATASYVLNAISASFATSASQAITASYILNAVSASFATTASYAVSASQAQNAVTASYVLNAISASFASTASSADDFTVRGTLTAQTIVVQTITSSTDFVTGSTRFGSSLNNTHQFTGSVSITGSLNVVGAGITGSLFGTASWTSNAISSSYSLSASQAQNSISSSYPLRVTGSSIYSFDTDQVANVWTIAIGRLTGFQTTAAPFSTFLGVQAGFQAVSASRSVFIGDSSGYQSTNANSSFFAGSVAGAESPNANNSVFIGTSAGYKALNASGSVFLGYNAGEQAVNSAFSTIIGYNAGEFSHSSSFSTLIGYNVGSRIGASSGISSNNIIIGTNITLAAGRQDSINLGGLIFGTGSYSNINTNPFSGSANGRVGINQPLPGYSLDVSGSGNYTNGLTVTGSLIASFVTGSLLGTASWANNAISASYALTASYVLNAISASYSLSSSYASNADLLDGKDSTIFATTGSNTFIGNQIITGSLNITGNETIKGFIRLDSSITNIDTSLSASYIFVSGSTNDLYFVQNGNGYNNTTRLRWLEGNLYTGLLHGGLITTVTGSTWFNLSSGSGVIVSLNASLSDDPYPTIKYVSWGNFISQSITYLTSSIQSYIGIDNNGQITQQNIPFINGEYNTKILIGSVLHQNKTTVNASITYPNVAYGYKQRTYDFIKAFGPLKLSGYTITPSSSLGLTVGSGTAFADGRNYQTDPNNPSYITDPGTNVSKIFRYYQSGSEFVQDTNGGLGYTVIDPTNYNPGGSGSLVAVPGTGTNREWSIQRVFWYPNSATKGIVVYYGNQIYANEIDAAANINYEQFLEVENTKQNAVYLGALLLRNDAVFTDTTTYKILPGGIFRSVGGSGGGGNITSLLLSQLGDVTISGPTNGQALVYDSSTSKWKNLSYISASISGNAVTATSASYALSASQAQNANTASYILNAVSASFASTSSLPLRGITTASVAGSTITFTKGDSSTFNITIATATAETASYVSSSNVDGPFGKNSILSASYAVSASQAQNTISSSYPIAISGSTIYSPISANNTGFNTFQNIILGDSAAYNTTNAFRSVYLGASAGYLATDSFYSNYIGYFAGYDATNAFYSNFIGNTAGEAATNANNSNFLGNSTGRYATNANNSNFLGTNVGAQATNANNSNFIGNDAGLAAINANNSNFIGQLTGVGAESASYSTLIGYQVGYASSAALTIKSNNIIIGTNITLGAGRQDSINIGGLIFGTGSYSDINTQSSGSANGRIGINQPLPLFSLDVSGSGRYTNSLTITGSLIASSITGSLQGTASWANNTISSSYALSASNAQTASYILNAVSASYALSASQAQNAVTASYILNAVSASFATTASYAVSASQAQNATTASYILNAISASFASTASSADNFTVRGTLTAQTIIVQTITSSQDFVTGSTRFGTLLTNTHQFTGSVGITGSLNVVGAGITSSLFGTASWASNAISSSYALSASQAQNANTASYVLNAISASFATSASQAQNAVTASYVLNAISSSFANTASYVLNAVSSSFATSASQASNALTASYVLNAISASYALSASQAQNAVTASYILNAVSASFAATASNVLGGAANYIPLWNGATTLSSSVMYQSASNVGIGTTSPGSKLSVSNAGAEGIEIRPAISSNLNQIFSYNRSSSDRVPLDIDAKTLAIQTEGTTKLFVSNTGNIGIGTTSPSYKFHVVSSDTTVGAFRNSSAANSQLLIGNTAGDLSIRTLSTGDGYIFSDTGKYLDFGTNASFRMRITSAGDVGIGTTSPGAKLEVSGLVRVTGTNGFSIGADAGQNRIQYSTSTFSRFALLSSGDSYTGLTAKELSIGATYGGIAPPTSGIIVEGNVGIGTTTPNAKLDVNGNAIVSGSLTATTTFTLDATLTDYATVASSIVGSNNLFTQATGSYTSVFFKYTVSSGSNTRAGEVVAAWNGASTQFYDNSTVDIGTTTAVTSSVSIVGSDVQFNVQTNTSGWRIKSLATFI